MKANDLEKRIVFVRSTYCNSKNDTSLKDLMAKYKLDSAVLKVDGAASIKKLLSEDDDSLKMFKRIQILYEGSPDEIQKRLEAAGFKVTLQKRALKGINGNTGFVCAEL